MKHNNTDNPIYSTIAVALPDGRILSRAHLPKTDLKYWSARHKMTILHALQYGLMSESDVHKKYKISSAELQEWMQKAQKYGEKALRVTMIDHYRKE